jgi:hypothetical protein
MTKEEAKAYCEILDNLKRDLAAKCDNDTEIAKVVNLICDKIEGYASGVYLNKNDELIILPHSALEEIRQKFVPQKPVSTEDNPLGLNCIKCTHFCDIHKMRYYTFTKTKCPDFEVKNNGR